MTGKKIQFQYLKIEKAQFYWKRNLWKLSVGVRNYFCLQGESRFTSATFGVRCLRRSRQCMKMQCKLLKRRIRRQPGTCAMSIGTRNTPKIDQSSSTPKLCLITLQAWCKTSKRDDIYHTDILDLHIHLKKIYIYIYIPYNTTDCTHDIIIISPTRTHTNIIIVHRLILLPHIHKLFIKSKTF